MSFYYFIYYSLIISSILLSFVAFKKGHKRFLVLAVLLFVTLIVEYSSELLIKHGREFVWMYHLFSPIEYTLIAIFLISAIKESKVKKLFRVTIPAFILFSLLISFFFYQFKTMPGINLAVEGLLVSGISTYRLFNLDAQENPVIFGHADFWICTGLLIFFGVCSFFFGIYTPLFKLSTNDAFSLFGLIVDPLNLVLYSFITIGLLCLVQKKKYITQ
jgi:hypothetical protein